VGLSSFAVWRHGLPYPGTVTTSVDRATAAIVDGLACGRSRVYVPRAVAGAIRAKGTSNSPLAWPWTRRFAVRAVPAFEREVEELGGNAQPVPAADDRVVEAVSS
jgi:hypothetical protein